jgi:hypothetical protein
MTAPGGDNPHDEAAPFPRPEQSLPWQQHQHPPVDPQAPVNYPGSPPSYPPPPPVPPYGYQPPPPGGPPTYAGPPGYGGPPIGPPTGYGGPPGYPVPYDPYHPYFAGPAETNGLAIASLVTSIAGVVLGIPLAVFCYIGLLIPVVGAVLGAAGLNQIKQTHQQGRGLAIAGIVIGTITATGLILIWLFVTAAALHSMTLR